MKFRILVWTLLFVLTIVIGFHCTFIVEEMASISMEPLISGRGNPPVRTGDLVIATKLFRLSCLESNDLVVVEIPTPDGLVTTVRQISQTIDSSNKYFTVSATAGLDSRHFGPIPAKNIRGRVVKVFK